MSLVGDRGLLCTCCIQSEIETECIRSSRSPKNKEFGNLSELFAEDRYMARMYNDEHV